MPRPHTPRTDANLLSQRNLNCEGCTGTIEHVPGCPVEIEERRDRDNRNISTMLYQWVKISELESKNAALLSALEALVPAVRRLIKVCPDVKLGDIFDAGIDAIEAAGLNPWCINEGRATGDEPFDLSGLVQDELKEADEALALARTA